MTATKNEIKRWVEQGLEKEATHVIIALDTWDHDNYPVYVSKSENVHQIVNSYETKEDRIDEVYNLSQNISEQLNQSRAWNL